ncbi:hypothetical protein ABIA38_008296 [Embleya sp. AB8]
MSRSRLGPHDPAAERQFRRRLRNAGDRPAFTVPLSDGLRLHVVYENADEDTSVEYVAHHPAWEEAEALARDAGHWRGPGLSWSELTQATDNALPGGTTTDPDTRLLLLLPALGDADLPSGAGARLAAVLRDRLGAAQPGRLAACMLRRQGMGGPARWSAGADGVRVNDGRYSLRGLAFFGQGPAVGSCGRSQLFELGAYFAWRAVSHGRVKAFAFVPEFHVPGDIPSGCVASRVDSRVRPARSSIPRRRIRPRRRRVLVRVDGPRRRAGRSTSDAPATSPTTTTSRRPRSSGMSLAVDTVTGVRADGGPGIGRRESRGPSVSDGASENGVGPGSTVELLVAVGRTDYLGAALDRETQRFLGLSASGVPPLSLVDAIIAAHWTPGLKVLVHNEQALDGVPGLRDRLTTTGDPRLALAVLQGRTWTKRDHRQVLAGADPRPQWRDLWASVRRWLIDGDAGPALAAAAVCPFPDVPTHLLSEPEVRLSRAELLRALSSLRTHGGEDALRRVFDAPRVGLFPDVRELLEAAVGAGVDVLRAAVVEAEGTVGLVEELRHADTYSEAADSLVRRADVDAPTLLTAHEQAPFGPHTAQALAERPDCPPELLIALCRTHPRPDQLLRSSVTTPPVTILGELAPQRVTAKVLEVLVERCADGGPIGEYLFTHARPAKAVPALAHKVDPFAPGPVWEGFHVRLAEVVRAGLGADAAAWRAVAELLHRFRGTVTELVDKGVRQATTNAVASTPWPAAADAPGHTEPPRLDVRRRAFISLADAAADRTMDALTPHMDDRTAYDVIVHGRWRPARLAELIAGAPSRELALTARHPRLPADAVAPLAALDDPEMNAGLVYQVHANGRLLHDIVQGIPRRPHPDGTRLALSPALRAELLPEDGRYLPRQWLTPFVGSGDPELLAAALGVVQISSRHLQLKMVLGRWERAGRDAVEVPHRFSDTTKTLIAKLRADPDQRAALETLREHVHDAESAESLAKRLRTTTTRSLPQLCTEHLEVHVSVLRPHPQYGHLVQDMFGVFVQYQGELSSVGVVEPGHRPTVPAPPGGSRFPSDGENEATAVRVAELDGTLAQRRPGQPTRGPGRDTRKGGARPSAGLLDTGSGGRIRTMRPLGYEPSELPSCSTPRRYDQPTDSER